MPYSQIPLTSGQAEEPKPQGPLKTKGRFSSEKWLLQPLLHLKPSLRAATPNSGLAWFPVAPEGWDHPTPSFPLWPSGAAAAGRERPWDKCMEMCAAELEPTEGSLFPWLWAEQGCSQGGIPGGQHRGSCQGWSCCPGGSQAPCGVTLTIPWVCVQISPSQPFSWKSPSLKPLFQAENALGMRNGTCFK